MLIEAGCDGCWLRLAAIVWPALLPQRKKRVERVVKTKGEGGAVLIKVGCDSC